MRKLSASDRVIKNSDLSADDLFEKLKQEIVKQDLTMKDIAEKTEFPASMLSKLFNEKPSNFKRETVEKIANALGYTITFNLTKS